MRKLKLICLWVVLLLFVVAVPSTMAADATGCWKQTKTIGVGKVPNCAPGQDKDAGLCYKKCDAGFHGVGPVCWGKCNEGYHDDGATCRRDAHIFGKGSYGRGAGYALWDKGKCEKAHGSCEKYGAIWYPKCKDGYDNVGCCVCRQKTCPSGYHDDGATCRRDVHIYGKPSKGRGVGTVPKTCPADIPHFQAGLCYKQCPAGYKGYGPVCWKRCTYNNIIAKAGGANMPTECGAACSPSSQACATFTQQLVAAGLKIASDIVIAIAAEDPEKLTDIPDQVQKYLDVPYCE
jgi:hypothetical protein